MTARGGVAGPAALLAAVLALPVACRQPSQPGPSSPPSPSIPPNSPAAVLAPACAGDGGTRIEIGLAGRLVLAAEVPAAAEGRVRDAALRWAACAGVTLDLRPGPGAAPRLTLPVPFAVTRLALAALDPAAAEQALTAPLAEILRRAAPPDLHPTVLIVLPDLAPPDSAAAGELPELTGLGLPGAPGPPLASAAWTRALPAARAAAVLLSWERLRRMDPGAAAHTVGHEWGHAAGLDHDPRPGNLMNPAGAAPGWLDPAQAAQLRASTGDR